MIYDRSSQMMIQQRLVVSLVPRNAAWPKLSHSHSLPVELIWTWNQFKCGEASRKSVSFSRLFTSSRWSRDKDRQTRARANWRITRFDFYTAVRSHNSKWNTRQIYEKKGSQFGGLARKGISRMHCPMQVESAEMSSCLYYAFNLSVVGASH